MKKIYNDIKKTHNNDGKLIIKSFLGTIALFLGFFYIFALFVASLWNRVMPNITITPFFAEIGVMDVFYLMALISILFGSTAYSKSIISEKIKELKDNKETKNNKEIKPKKKEKKK